MVWSGETGFTKPPKTSRKSTGCDTHRDAIVAR